MPVLHKSAGHLLVSRWQQEVQVCSAESLLRFHDGGDSGSFLLIWAVTAPVAIPAAPLAFFWEGSSCRCRRQTHLLLLHLLGSHHIHLHGHLLHLAGCGLLGLSLRSLCSWLRWQGDRPHGAKGFMLHDRRLAAGDSPICKGGHEELRKTAIAG